MPKPARPALKKLLRDNLLTALDDALAAARTANEQAPCWVARDVVEKLEVARSYAVGLYVEEQP